MIESDEVGQQQLEDLLDMKVTEFTKWELKFLNLIHGQEYAFLTDDQKSTVVHLWEKYFI